MAMDYKCWLASLSAVVCIYVVTLSLFIDSWSRPQVWLTARHSGPEGNSIQQIALKHPILSITQSWNQVDRSTKKFVTEVSKQSTTEELPSFESKQMESLFGFFRSALNGGLKVVKRTRALKNKRLDRIWDVWNITFVIDRPDLCNCTVGCDSSSNDQRGNVTVVVVNSAPDHIEARVSIRETWGKLFSSMSDVRLTFFVGRSPNATVQKSLEEEDVRERDVVQADFIDAYNNLTLKSVLMLRWINLHCSRSRFLFKVDDDVFVNPANLMSFLHRNGNLSLAIFGKLGRNWGPDRDPTSHYFVPESIWASDIYPDFVAGPAYVLTSDAVPKLLQQVTAVPYFFLEDVYVTGMCAQKANISRWNHRGFTGFKHPASPCLYRKYIAVHDLDPNEMRTMWQLLQRFGPEAEVRTRGGPKISLQGT